MELGERLILDANSEEKSIILIVHGELRFACEGMYGGYILKPPLPSDLNNVRAFFVEPTIIKVDNDAEKNELKDKYLSKHICSIPELNERFSSDYRVEVVKYKLVEVKVVEKKRTDKYLVIDFKPYPNGEKLEGEAIRFYHLVIGTRRRPGYPIAKKFVEELRLKYPENDFIQEHVYAKPPADRRGPAIFIKIVTKAPKISIQTCDDKTETTTELKDLEEEINQLNEIIRQKEEELNRLKQRLQTLMLKLQTEKLKAELV